MSTAKAARLLGVTTRTMRRYTASGKLPDNRSPGGVRVFGLGDLHTFAARASGAALPCARVSSRRQLAEGDLARQVARLQDHLSGREVAGVSTEVASGLSDRRSGLRRALRSCVVKEARAAS